MGVVLNDVLSAKKNKNFDWFYQSTYLLITAIKEDDREALEYLLRLVNEYNQGNSSSKRNLKKYFETQMNEPGVIEAVVGCNNVSIFKLLVSAGIIINYKDKKVGTLLHEASRQGRKHIVKLLIENGVNVNYKDEKGQSPLHEAARQGHIDTVNFLIENGAKVNDKNKNKQSPLHEATSKGHTDVAKFLIKNGANVNAIDGAGYTPLHWAGCYGHESTFEALLEVKDIDLLAKDKNGDTALYPAAVGNHIKCADHFIKEVEKRYSNIKKFDLISETRHQKSFTDTPLENNLRRLEKIVKKKGIQSKIK